MLILPGDDEFDQTLASAQMLMQPGFAEKRAALSGEFALVYRPGSLIPEMVPLAEAQEYLMGGEYDERLLEIEEPEPDEQLIEILSNPWEG